MERPLEYVMNDFLRLFFKQAHAIFDFEKDFTLLNKELADLFPHEDARPLKFVHKLIKVSILTDEQIASALVVH